MPLVSLVWQIKTMVKTTVEAVEAVEADDTIVLPTIDGSPPCPIPPVHGFAKPKASRKRTITEALTEPGYFTCHASIFMYFLV